jgi:hypothetical protein
MGGWDERQSRGPFETQGRQGEQARRVKKQRPYERTGERHTARKGRAGLRPAPTRGTKGGAEAEGTADSSGHPRRMPFGRDGSECKNRK